MEETTSGGGLSHVRVENFIDESKRTLEILWVQCFRSHLATGACDLGEHTFRF